GYRLRSAEDLVQDMLWVQPFDLIVNRSGFRWDQPFRHRLEIQDGEAPRIGTGADALLKSDQPIVRGKRRALHVRAKHRELSQSEFAAHEVSGAAGSQRGVERVAVGCEGHTPEIGVNGAQPGAVPPCAELFQIADGITGRHVDERGSGREWRSI